MKGEVPWGFSLGQSDLLRFTERLSDHSGAGSPTMVPRGRSWRSESRGALPALPGHRARRRR